jgi:hypothetical protein
MVEVEMADDDVANVVRVEAQPAHLCDRGLLGAELDVVEREEERTQPLVRAGHVADAKAGVDQDQAGVALDQQAVADQPPKGCFAFSVEQPPAERAAGAAVEVMDAHQRGFQARRSAVRRRTGPALLASACQATTSAPAAASPSSTPRTTPGRRRGTATPCSARTSARRVASGSSALKSRAFIALLHDLPKTAYQRRAGRQGSWRPALGVGRCFGRLGLLFGCSRWTHAAA